MPALSQRLPWVAVGNGTLDTPEKGCRVHQAPTHGVASMIAIMASGLG
jgi:hypothetical protein